MNKKDFYDWLDTMPNSGDYIEIEDNGDGKFTVVFTGNSIIYNKIRIKTLKHVDTDLVVEINDFEYERFFDNRDPSEWTLIKETEYYD